MISVLSALLALAKQIYSFMEELVKNCIDLKDTNVPQIQEERQCLSYQQSSICFKRHVKQFCQTEIVIIGKQQRANTLIIVT